jgi:hypothetical protein
MGIAPAGDHRPQNYRAMGNYEWLKVELAPRQELLLLEQRAQRIVVNAAFRRQPMDKVSGADVRWLLNFLSLKARLQVCLFARVGHYLPSLRLH